MERSEMYRLVLEAALKHDDTVLETIIGRELMETEGQSDAVEASFREPDLARERFQHWYQEHRQKLAAVICGSERVRDNASNPDRLVLGSCVFDAINGLVPWVVAATVAALIIKRGVKNICKEAWEQKGAHT